jgi:hypothetical protein
LDATIRLVIEAWIVVFKSPIEVTGESVGRFEADLKTPLPRKLTFSDPEKIRELARRGEPWQMLENAIENGRSGVYLRLTPEQYRALRRR